MSVILRLLFIDMSQWLPDLKKHHYGHSDPTSTLYW
jgi:hypothetical protein